MDILKRVYLQLLIGMIDVVFVGLSILCYWQWSAKDAAKVVLYLSIFLAIAGTILWIGCVINASFISREVHNNNGVIASCLLGGLGAALSAAAEIVAIKEKKFEEALEIAQEKTMEAHLKMLEENKKNKQNNNK